RSREALGQALQEGDTAAGMRVGAALGRFWSLRGHLPEGRERLAELLQHAREGSTGRSAFLARALGAAGALAKQQGDYEASDTLLQEALEIGRGLQLPEVQILALNGL